MPQQKEIPLIRMNTNKNKPVQKTSGYLQHDRRAFLTDEQRLLLELCKDLIKAGIVFKHDIIGTLQSSAEGTRFLFSSPKNLSLLFHLISQSHAYLVPNASHMGGAQQNMLANAHHTQVNIYGSFCRHSQNKI